MARRRYQRGSIFIRSGNFVGRWREDVIENCAIRRVRRTEVLCDCKEHTKREAQRILDLRLESVNAIDYRPKPMVTCGEFFTRWEKVVLPNYKISCRATMQGHIKLYLRPVLGDNQLRFVNGEAVQNLINQVPRSPQTVRNVLNTLRSIWNAARAWGYVSGNPFEYLQLPRRRRSERKQLTIEQVGNVLAKAEEPLKTFLWIASETGLRVGEVCGLRVQDVDFERKLLFVRSSSWQGKLQDPKSNHRDRVCKLSSHLIKHLGEYFAQKWVQNSEGLVFAGKRSKKPWDQHNLLSRHFHPLLEKLELPKVGFHSLRHFNSTWMDHENVPTAIRTKRLGHSDATVTLNYYTEAITADEDAMVDRLGEALMAKVEGK